MATVYAKLPSYSSLMQPPKESETLRKAIVRIHDLTVYEKDTLFLRSSSAVVYALFVSCISTLDAVSYLARIPIQFTSSLLALEFKEGFFSIGHNVANTVNSLKISVLLVISAVAGIFFPYQAFKLLPDTRPALQKIDNELQNAQKLLAAKQQELDETNQALATQSSVAELRCSTLEKERKGLEPRVQSLQ